MALPSIDSVHALTDPGNNGRGGRILRTVVNGSTTSYFVDANVSAPGRSGWVDVNTNDTAAQHNTAIRAKFGF